MFFFFSTKVSRRADNAEGRVFFSSRRGLRHERLYYGSGVRARVLSALEGSFRVSFFENPLLCADSRRTRFRGDGGGGEILRTAQIV